MKTNLKQNGIIFLLAAAFLAVFFTGMVSATYTQFSVAYTNNPLSISSGTTLASFYNPQMCKAGQDFILQIDPTGCTPSVVRSDLLADQNQPVLCPIVATQLNPMITVNSIDNIQITGQLPPGVQGVGYLPARSALATLGSSVNTQAPVFNALGYAVILLKQQPNESALPDYVAGNLTAYMRYNIQNAFGIGQATYYLPMISDQQWNDNLAQYSFWNGKGYLKADSITDNTATISVYSGTNNPYSSTTQKQKIATVTLDTQNKKTSPALIIPGFNYCFGTMNLQLDGLENPDRMAKIEVNGNVLELKQGEQFLNNKCTLKSVDSKGIVQEAKISCQVDQGSGTVDLKIVPKLNVSITTNEGGKTVTKIKTVGIGDFLYNQTDSNGKPTGKYVFVGYIGTTDEGKLFIVPTVSSKAQTSAEFENTLAFQGLPSAINSLSWQSSGLVKKSVDFLSSRVYATGVSFASWLSDGTVPVGFIFADGKFTPWPGSLTGVLTDAYNKIFGNQDDYTDKVKIIGYAGPVDTPLSGGLKNNYTNAVSDYESVQQEFSTDKYPTTGSTTLGEEALYNETMLAYDVSQKRTALQLCQKFEKTYADSTPPSFCSDLEKLASNENDVQDVSIEGQTYRISLDNVADPSLNDYSVVVTVSGAADGYNGQKTVGFDGRVQLNKTEFVTLTDLENGYAAFDTSNVKQTLTQQAKTISSTQQVKLHEVGVFGANGYSIKVDQINLQKLAKVSLIPNVNLVQSNATFKFKIGIEKRAIQLTPQQTESRIKSLNKTINTIQSINNNLGKVVQTEKAVCLVTESALTLKNFLTNLGGEGIARQKVMETSGTGWFDKCNAMVKAGQYSTVDKCLAANSNEIDSEVKTYSDAISNYNDYVKNLEKGITTSSSFLGEGVVNTTAFMNKLITNDYRTNLLNTVQGQFPNDEISIAGMGDVGVSTIINSITPSNILVTQAKDLQLNSQILASATDSTTKQIALAQIKSDLTDYYVNAQQSIEQQNFANKLGLSAAQTNFIISKGATQEPYTGLTYKDIQSKVTLKGVTDSSTPVATILTSDGKEYYATLTKSGNNYAIKQLYDMQGNPDTKDKLNVYFQYADASTYQNQYLNPEASFYETGQYQGLPAIVPFDQKNGWYVAVKSVLPVGGSIQAYDSSGRANSFYLCNVGSNGKEEFNSNVGGANGDICEQINLGTGQPYNAFNGLSAAQAAKEVSCAVNALQQASTARQKGGAGLSSITISTACGGTWKGIKVGAPATNTPDIQCQDFMSPSDCTILFNACDPVVCPSSRCNLGGTYPVTDVVQSGVIGSLALCFPNRGNPANGGVVIPVCLTGLNAGLDGLNSVFKSYQQCLQTSLTTGQTVGVCDEINSIYMCDFLWKEILPIAQYAVPRLIGKAVGGNTRGGGEYLNAQSAFDQAKSSVSYFTQYYAANSYKAFQARSTQDVGTAVCKNWVSYTTPNGGGLLDSLTAPDSPAQFYGTFSSESYETATNPPTSQYKVYYHIYAGKDYPAYYQVYLKGSGSSYYQDTTAPRIVDQGVIPTGGTTDKTSNFLAPTGYNQMCISVNGQEQCGFQQVTTDFGINYAADKAVASQASQTNITSSAACVSGTPSAYSLLNPNLQTGVTNVANPAIYNQGITRICATADPGQGTDSNAGTQSARWVDVGYCDTPTMRCWLDTNSVKSAITSTSIQNQTLKTVEAAAAGVLNLSKAGYVTDFPTLVQNMNTESNLQNRITLITGNLSKVFYSYEKGYLTLLRGDTYAEIATRLFQDFLASNPPTKTTTPTQTQLCVAVTLPDGSSTNIPIPSTMTQKQYCDTYSGTGNNYQSCVAADCTGSYTIPGTDLTVPGTPVSILPADVTNAIASSDYSKLQYPVLNLNGIYYFFYSGQWFWSPDKLRWINVQLSEAQTTSQAQSNPLFAQQDASSITTFIDLFNQQSSTNQGYIKSLVGVSYGGGLNILMSHEKSNGGGSWFFGLGGYSLFTDHVSMDSNGVFKVSNSILGTYISRSAYYYFQYDINSNKWQWEPVGGSWADVPDLNGQTPPQKFQDLINSLDGKTFAEGAQILFALDAGAYGTSTSSGTGGGTSGTTNTYGISCNTRSDCQTTLGAEVIKLAQQIQSQKGISDAQVLTDTGVKSFPCLALMIANVESTFQQCGTAIGVGYEQSGNPLYCAGNPSELLNGDSADSQGLMQVNTAFKNSAGQNTGFCGSYGLSSDLTTCKNQLTDLDTNIIVGLNHLVDGYSTTSKTFTCTDKSYSGWERAIRNYNGWGCTGNNNYVENVLSTNNRNLVAKLFPQCA